MRKIASQTAVVAAIGLFGFGGSPAEAACSITTVGTTILLG